MCWYTTIYTNVVMVHTAQTSRRVEIDLTVGYTYDIRRIMDIIQSALEPIEQTISDPPPQVLCWELGVTSLGVKVRWGIRPQLHLVFQPIAEYLFVSRSINADNLEFWAWYYFAKS